MTNSDQMKNAPAATARAVWVKPAVTRTDAGSAEAGGRANADGGLGRS